MKAYNVVYDVPANSDIITQLIKEMVLKVIRITMQVIIYVFVLVYAEVRTFIVTCPLYSCLTNQWQRFRKVSHS